MRQEAKYTITHFVNAAEKAINGATLHRELIVINGPEALAEEMGELLAKRDVYENRKSAWAASRAAARAVSETARAKLAMARDLLKPHFGTRYNQSWDITGLVGSTEIPRAFEQVKALLLSFKAHFVAHPERENGALAITAAAFTTLHAQMVSVQNEELNTQTEVKRLLRERNAAMRVLEKRLRDLFGELKMRLDPMDPRWLAFGFKLPGLQERPETPGPVAPVLVTAESASVKWAPAPRAKRYRVWLKEGEAEPKLAGTGRGRSFVLEDLKGYAGKVSVAISAVNSGGESDLSPWKVVREAIAKEQKTVESAGVETEAENGTIPAAAAEAISDQELDAAVQTGTDDLRLR